MPSTDRGPHEAPPPEPVVAPVPLLAAPAPSLDEHAVTIAQAATNTKAETRCEFAVARMLSRLLLRAQAKAHHLLLQTLAGQSQTLGRVADVARGRREHAPDVVDLAGGASRA